jgi:hypothetical protein
MIEIPSKKLLRKFVLGVRFNAVSRDTVEIHGNEIHFRCVAESGRQDLDADEPILYEFLVVQGLDSGQLLGAFVFLCRSSVRVGTLMSLDGLQVGEWSADVNFFIACLYNAAMLAGRAAQSAYPPVGPNELGKFFESFDEQPELEVEPTIETYVPKLKVFKETERAEVLESTPSIEIQRVYRPK